jgi:ATP:ADP antiporter, AAA family
VSSSESPLPNPERQESLPHRLLNRVVDVRGEEVGPLLLGIACYALLLTGYYILRPLRETVGIHAGSEQLPYLMLTVLALSMVLNPLYSNLVARLPRSRFIPLVYRGLIGLLLLFYFALEHLEGSAVMWAGRGFYVFLSVANLFMVSLFWSLMADLFDRGRAVRLFATIAMGGSLGALLGSSITGHLVGVLGPANLVLISICLIELATRTALAIHRRFERPADASDVSVLSARPDIALGGSRWAGFQAIARSPYLIGISSYMVLYGLSSTFTYMIQGQVVERAAASEETRTEIFANIDFWTNAVTFVFQAGITARLMKNFGAGPVLILLPVYTAIGFLLLSSGWFEGASMLTALMVFQVFRRALGYGVSKPVREMLYTILPAEEKYKAKNLVDISMPRTGDALGALTTGALKSMGMGLGALALAAMPLSALWVGVGLGLGVVFRRSEKSSGRESA